MSDRPRDSQKRRLYQAETRAYVQLYGKPDWSHPMKWPEVEEFIRSIEKTRWWRNRRPGWVKRRDYSITIQRGRRDLSGAWAQRSHWKICLSTWAMTKPIILHELAHLITSDAHAAHGPEYVKNFLAIARRFDPELAAALDEEFKAGKVRRR